MCTYLKQRFYVALSPPSPPPSLQIEKKREGYIYQLSLQFMITYMYNV